GRELDNLLAASAVKILHRCGSPEPIIQFAGKREVYKFSRSLGKEATEPGDLYHPYANEPGEASAIMRPADEYTVPIETVQQLPPGHVVLIQSGQEAYVRVAALSVPSAAVESASDSIMQAGHYQPLTPPPAPPPKKNDKKTGQRKNTKKEALQAKDPTPAGSAEQAAKPAGKAEEPPLFPTLPALASAPSTSPDSSEKPPVPPKKEGDDTIDFFA
ncbi:MAG: hypothetical protein ACRDHW_08630, partial [Ktedonobacteraceae bacterium]